MEHVPVEPPHFCAPSCGEPCETYRQTKETEYKIKEIKESLESTLLLYRGLRAKMNILHDPMVSRVPLEVATTIFHFCLPNVHNPIRSPFILDKDEKEDYNARVLFTLGGVSKTWRHIIWSTPSFWSHLSICIKPSTLSKSVDIAKDWLDRSAQIPLSIQVYLTNRRNYDFDVDGDEDFVELNHPERNEKLMAGVSSLSNVINSSSTRWESLDLRLPPALFSMFHGEPSNLQQLRFDNYVQDRDPEVSLLSAEGGKKPTPFYVAFDFVRFRSLDISWTNVTCIDTQGIDLPECVELLREVPQLTQCNFRVIKPPRNPWVGSRHVVHHGLKVLKFLLLIQQGLDDHCFDHFTLPSLQHLSSVQLFYSPLRVRNIMSLLERSSCHLGSLDLGAVFVEETLVAMLKQLPSLHHLSLRPCITDDAFTAEGFFKLLARTSLLPCDEIQRDKDQNQAPTLNVSSSAQNSVEGLPTSGEDPSNSSPLNQEVFLPQLESFQYIQYLPEECTRIWDLIPGAFGYLTRKDYDPQFLRPLRSMSVTLPRSVFMADGRLDPPGYIGKTTLEQIKELIDKGCNIEVSVTARPRMVEEDFIASSVAWHAGRLDF